jgi:molecular chaperone GrpE
MADKSTSEREDEALDAADEAGDAAARVGDWGDPDAGDGAQADPVEAGAETAGAAELAAARDEAAANRELYVRALAELQNAQRRYERDRVDLAKYAAEGLLRDLLPTLDDLERAIGHAGASGAAQGEGLVAGVEMVLRGLTAALEKHGVRRITALGEPFDPAKHEAVGMAESPDATPGTVIAEHRAGYMLADRLLRPAMVVVAKAKAAATDS